MHSSSRKWISADHQARGQQQMLNAARKRVCRLSPIWTVDFDLAAHKRDYKEAMKRVRNRELRRLFQQAKEKARLEELGYPSNKPTPREPFNGKRELTFADNRGYVTARKTVFCPSWESKEDIAPWPSQAEMKYEGEDRIFTDSLHRRFLALPRVDVPSTANWQQKSVVYPEHFDDFWLGSHPVWAPLVIFLRNNYVAPLEIDDDEGERVLGEDLMGLLDPKEQW